jgi:hypothetical protein
LIGIARGRTDNAAVQLRLAQTGGPFRALPGTLAELLGLTAAAFRATLEAAAAGPELDRDAFTLLAPIDGETEVWAAGVTYKRSADARVEESSTPDIYTRVYEARRPEIFFKATQRRVAGPGGPIVVRADSTWDVPEPEVAIVLNAHQRDRLDAVVRRDGEPVHQGRLRITITTVAASMLPWGQQMEMVAQHWKDIGILADIKDQERSLAVTTAQNNQHHIYVWGAGTEDRFLFPPHELPVKPSEPFTGPLFAQWYATGGTAGEKPTDPDLVKALELLRSASALQPDARLAVAKQIRQLIVDNQWVIGTVGTVPNVRVIRSNMKNDPDRISWRSRCRTPGATHPSTYYLTA